MFISSVRHVLRMSGYVTHKPVGMTHICRSLINSKRTFQKGQRGSCLGYGRSDSVTPLPTTNLVTVGKEINGQILLNIQGIKYHWC